MNNYEYLDYLDYLVGTSYMTYSVDKDEAKHRKASIVLKELVERATNGIYISKDKSKELLEALKGLTKYELHEDYEDMGLSEVDEYNKLHKALGGE